MSLFLVAVIAGVVTGAIYALAALGLVIVYRATRILNFAHGAMGMLSTYIFGRALHDAAAPCMSTPVAVMLTLVFAAALGLAVERFVMRPLREASLLTKMIATLALLTLIQFTTGALFGDATYFFRGIFPDGVVNIGIEYLPYSSVLDLVVTVGLVALITVFLQRTKMGIALRAVSNDPGAAEVVGINVDRINQVAWVMGALLACVAGLLLTPDFNLNTFTLTVTVIVYSVGAAVVGGFVSFPLTLVGGLLLGVATTLVRTYAPASAPGLDYLVGFGIVIAVLSMRRDLSLVEQL